MLQRLKKQKNKKGFTLVELIIVIAIIGILAAVLVPTMIGVVDQANASSANQATSGVYKIIDTIIMDSKLSAEGDLASEAAFKAAYTEYEKENAPAVENIVFQLVTTSTDIDLAPSTFVKGKPVVVLLTTEAGVIDKVLAVIEVTGDRKTKVGKSLVDIFGKNKFGSTVRDGVTFNTTAQTA